MLKLLLRPFTQKLQKIAHHYLDVGAFLKARTLLKILTKFESHNINTWKLLAETYIVQKRYLSAIACYQKALHFLPNSGNLYGNLASVFRLNKQINQAIHYLEVAIKLNPSPTWYNALGSIWLTQASIDRSNLLKAKQSFSQSLQLDPNFAETHSYMGIIYQQMGKADQATAHFRKAIALDPASVSGYSNYGLALREQGQLNESLSILAKAIKLYPYHPDLHCTLGLTLQSMGKYEEALISYNSALKLDPTLAKAQWLKALYFLLLGNFSEGWTFYESRFAANIASNRLLPFPKWNGSSLKNLTILVYGEQGIGDEIMFSSCLSDIIKQAKLCIIECNQRLLPLFTRSFPAAIVTHNWKTLSSTEFKIDVQCPIGSIPSYCRRSWKDFPTHQGYLTANPERIKYWTEKLNSLGEGLKIGIAWRGGSYTTGKQFRLIELNQWQEILKIKEIHFISLQYTDCIEEIGKVETEYGVKIYHWQEAIDNYEETAALVNSLDLIISVCTAVIHLGGALGKKVWVMVPTIPEWRYLREGNSMPWYPTVRLFRQTELNNWAPVINQVALELQAKSES